MGEKRKRRDVAQTESPPSIRRRYRLWALATASVVIPVGIGIFFVLGGGDLLGSAADPITGTSDVPRITPEDVMAKVDTGANLILVDTRSEPEYARTHAAGAISMPLEDIPRRYGELEGYDEVVTYCT